MAEAQARAEARRGTMIQYIPPLNFEEQLTSVKQATFDDIVIKSPFRKMDPAAMALAIQTEYNKNVKEHVIGDAGARSGERIEAGLYLLAHRNRVPELAVGHGQRLNLKITGGYTETGFIGGGDGKFRMTDPIVGAYGSYVLNIPQGKIGRIWLGNTPVLYGEGIHVVHDPLLRMGNEDTAAGNQAGFQWLRSFSEQYLRHGNLHILRVPVGQYAKVTVDTHAMLLPYRKEPYCFDTALFEFKGFVGESEFIIEHGPLHLIRVPAGKVGTAWLGSRPLLLEYREEPYFFDDALFKFEPKQGQGSKFYDADLKHLQHGAINRIRPGVKGDLEVAVVQCDGNLEFIEHTTTLDNANWAVLGFLNMGLQTHVFPSKETRDERRRENPKATAEEIAYEPMTTKDSLKVGLKLLVAFQVNNPHKVMKRLRLADIVIHVENLAVSDMARAVQNSTSQNFLNSSHHKAGQDGEEAPAPTSIADQVRAQLAEHLEDCGLKLVRFNVEEAKVLDEQLAKEMAKQALVAATASAQQAVIEQKAAVAKSNAELEAMARRVQQEQENQIRVSAAQAELEAQRLSAEGILVKAEAEQKAAELRGAQFRKYPELLQLEIARCQMQALKGSSVTFVSTDLAKTPFGSANGFAVAGLPTPKQ